MKGASIETGMNLLGPEHPWTTGLLAGTGEVEYAGKSPTFGLQL